jgi:hypothetical protein
MMSNLTITIDDELLRAARVKAVQQGTSVNEVCRQAIAAFALDDQAEAQARAHARARAFTEFSNSLALSPRSGVTAPAALASHAGKTSRDDRVRGMLAEKSPPGPKR